MDKKEIFNRIEYVVACVGAFAQRYQLSNMQAYAYLRRFTGIEIVEPDHADECCGFGGMFSVEETGVSRRLGQKKLERHIATGARYITGADCSCLMHLAGVGAKDSRSIEFRHVVEILASGL